MRVLEQARSEPPSLLRSVHGHAADEPDLALTEQRHHADLRQPGAATRVGGRREMLTSWREQRSIVRVDVGPIERHRVLNQLRRRARQIGDGEHATHAGQLTEPGAPGGIRHSSFSCATAALKNEP